MAPSDNTRWYARRNGTVRGPFTDEDMARYLLLGRIRLEDELSQDREGWRPARDYPALFPEELLHGSSREDYQKLVTKRMQADERLSQRRGSRGKISGPFGKERRRLADRRRCGGEAGFFKYPLRDDRHLAAQGPKKRQSESLRAFLLATLLATLLLALFSISAR